MQKLIRAGNNRPGPFHGSHHRALTWDAILSRDLYSTFSDTSVHVHIFLPLKMI